MRIPPSPFSLPPPPSLTHQHTTGRNTTRPHPEADLSPNATITSADIDASRTTHRSFRKRRSRYRHTLAHGKIDAASASSSELLRAPTSSSAGTGDDELDGVSVVMMPDGRISGEKSLEEARASFAADRGEPVEGKRGLFKRMLGQ